MKPSSFDLFWKYSRSSNNKSGRFVLQIEEHEVPNAFSMNLLPFMILALISCMRRTNLLLTEILYNIDEQIGYYTA